MQRASWERVRKPISWSRHDRNRSPLRCLTRESGEHSRYLPIACEDATKANTRASAKAAWHDLCGGEKGRRAEAVQETTDGTRRSTSVERIGGNRESSRCEQQCSLVHIHAAPPLARAATDDAATVAGAGQQLLPITQKRLSAPCPREIHPTGTTRLDASAHHDSRPASDTCHKSCNHLSQLFLHRLVPDAA